MQGRPMRRGNFEPPKQMTHRLVTLKRSGPYKIYRLKGYTTTSEVEEMWHSRKRMRFIQRTSILILFIVLLVLLFYWIAPIPKIQEMISVVGGGF